MKQKLLNSLRLRAFWLVAIMLCAVNGAWADDYSYTFQAKQFSSNSAATLNGVSWTLSGDGDYWGYDGTKGQQLGSGSKPYKSLALTTSGISGTITNIVVNASTAASASATISCTVGGSAFGNQSQSMSTSPTNYTFSGSASGTIVISMSQSTSKALYIKSVSVTYTTGGGDTPTTYTVTYDANGATSGDVPTDDSEYEEGDEVTVLGNTGDLSKTGCAFGGWNTQANGEGDDYDEDDTFEISANTTLYALWIPYAITAISNNENYGTVSLNGSVITATPASGYTYASPAYTVNPDNSATVAQDGNTFTVTPTADTEVTINFELLPTYTVTFGDEGSVAQETPGASVTLPSRSETAGYTFAGWSETNVASETTDAPTIIPAGSYTPTANITLYPVYTKAEGGSAPSAFSVGDTGNYAIVAELSAGNYYALPTNPTVNSGKITAEKITVSEIDGVKFVTPANAEGFTWTIAAATNGYTISDGSKYIYHSNGGASGTNLSYGTATNYTWNFTADDEYIKMAGMSGSTTNSRGLLFSSLTIGGYALSNWDSYGKTMILPITEGATTYYWSAPVAAAVVRPVIDVEANPFLFSTTATITCETEGAAIKYSFDGETWNNYTEALTITATTTIYAKAVKNEDESTVASVEVTKNLANPTVTVSGDLTVDLNGETDVEAGTLTATVTYNEEAVEGAVVTWISSDPDIATIDANTGAVTIKTRGTVTFTATYAGNSDYAEKTGTKQFTITDSKAPGSAGKPYTVAEARAAIDAGEGITDVYVAGIVSQVDSYNSTYHSITYWISEDGTTTDQFEVYSGKGIDGADFSSIADIQVGDVVVVNGNIKLYNTTYEFDKNNQLVSLVRKAEAGLEYETTEYEANLGEGFDTPELTNPNELTVTYSSSNTEVATVDENTGAVELVAEGETTITATFAGNASFKAGEASYTLTVINPSAPVDICELVSITPTTLTIGDMGEFDLTANFVDGVTEDEDYEITWTSSDPTILEVEGTTYEAKKAGEVTITVNVEVVNEETYNNVQKAFNVTVEAPKTYVALVAEYNGNYYAINDVSGATWGATEVDAVNGKVVNNKSDEISWAIDETSSNVTFTNKKTSEMLGFKSSGTDLQANGTITYVTWSKDTENNTWTNQNGKTSGTVRTLVYNGTGFKNYATSNVNGNGYSNYTHAYTFADGYTRTVTGGNWGTICLPNSVDADDYSGVTFYSIAGKTNSYLMLAEETELMAGVAYIFQADENATKLIAAYNEESIETPFAAEDNNGLEGSFTGTSVAQGMYVLKNNEIRLAGTGVTIGANRAYINMNEVPAYNGGGANVKALAIAGSDVDAIRGINADAQQGEAIYNIAGQKVQKAQKGLYIVNGKKVVF